MTSPLQHLIEKRASVLDQMQAVDRLRRGSLSKQFFTSTGGAQRGPYFVLQGFFHGEKFSERIPAQQAGEVQQQVDNYRRFQQLAEDYVTLTDQITRWEAAPDESKKNSSRRRWGRSASAKPKPS